MMLIFYIAFHTYRLKHAPEYYAMYQLINKKNFFIYSDKFSIGVIDLTQIELATEEDCRYGVNLWARVFTATTWEEIEMLAQNNEYLQEAVSGVRQLTAEEKIRQRCQDRETNAYWERIRAAETERLKQAVSDQQSTIDNYADKELRRILKKIKAGKSLEQIAEELEEDVENILPVYEKAIAQEL